MTTVVDKCTDPIKYWKNAAMVALWLDLFISHIQACMFTVEFRPPLA